MGTVQVQNSKATLRIAQTRLTNRRELRAHTANSHLNHEYPNCLQAACHLTGAHGIIDLALDYHKGIISEAFSGGFGSWYPYYKQSLPTSRPRDVMCLFTQQEPEQALQPACRRNAHIMHSLSPIWQSTSIVACQTPVPASPHRCNQIVDSWETHAEHALERGRETPWVI